MILQPVHLAAKLGNLKCFRVLVHHGADLRLQTRHGQTCRSLAAEARRSDMQALIAECCEMQGDKSAWIPCQEEMIADECQPVGKCRDTCTMNRVLIHERGQSSVTGITDQVEKACVDLDA